MTNNTIIINRTDSIGDVVLTLPLVNIVKSIFPKSTIVFLGSSYTKPILEYHQDISYILEWDVISTQSEKEQIQIFREIQADMIIHVFPVKKIAQLAKKAGIPIRIGTSHRIFHRLYCNKLVNLGRKHSQLHEAQLNIQLLRALGYQTHYDISELPATYNFKTPPPLPQSLQIVIKKDKINLILHPLSKGSAREWPPQYYVDLANSLSEDKYNIIFTGTQADGIAFADFIKQIKKPYHNLAGACNLSELVQLIYASDAIVAASTGPLHLAAALGKTAIGIYPPIRPMHPGRWAPIGKNAHVLCIDKTCNSCRHTAQCQCMADILPKQVINVLEQSFDEEISKSCSR
jgi:heptosyltransferase-3